MIRQLVRDSNLQPPVCHAPPQSLKAGLQLVFNVRFIIILNLIYEFLNLKNRCCNRFFFCGDKKCVECLAEWRNKSKIFYRMNKMYHPVLFYWSDWTWTVVTAEKRWGMDDSPWSDTRRSAGPSGPGNTWCFCGSGRTWWASFPPSTHAASPAQREEEEWVSES